MIPSGRLNGYSVNTLRDVLVSSADADSTGGYNAGKVIQSLQCTQDVPTGFQDTLPPVREEEKKKTPILKKIDKDLWTLDSRCT